MSVPQDTRFPPGQSGNPSGRPLGSRNKATLAREAALEERTAALAEHVVASQQAVCDVLTRRAMAGDTRAIRLMLASYLQRPSLMQGELDLPHLATVEEVMEAGQALINAALAGEIALADVLTLQRVLHNHARLLKIAAGKARREHPSTIAPAQPDGAAPASGSQTGQKQENTGLPFAPDPHATCSDPLLPMAEWLQVSGMGAKLAAARRGPTPPPDERMAA